MSQLRDPELLRVELSRLLAARPEIDCACLFGSFVGGGPYHDIDVAVFLRPAPPASTLLDYEMDLQVYLQEVLS